MPTKTIAMVIVVTILIAGCRRPAGPQEKTEPAKTSGPRKLALLIGIDKYRSPRIPTLRGSRNDVRAMQNVLIAKYGFTRENIRVVTDAKATYDGIVTAFREHLVKQASAGDIVVFHYSGHGSQDPSPDTASGSNESIVPYDSRDPKNLDISADAFSSMVAQLATKNITVIMDSCNSGRMVGVTRSPNEVVTPRGIDPPSDPPPAPPVPRRGTRGAKSAAAGFSPLDDSFVLLAAALAREYANEYQAGFETFGAMSYFLVRELEQATPDSTYRDIMDSVRSRVREEIRPEQTPQLVGSNADKYVFGNEQRLAEPYVLVSSKGSSVRLPFTGQVHGALSGAKYDVYGPEAHDFAPTAPRLGRLELTTVNAFDSEARLTEGGPLPEVARAVLRDRGTNAAPLRVWIDSASELDPLRKAAGKLSEIRISPDRLTANILIVLQGGNIRFRTPDGVELSNAMLPAQSEIAAADIVRWVHWFAMRSIENPGSGLKVRLELAPRDERAAGKLSQIGSPDNIFKVNDPLQLEVHNDSDVNVFVTLLALSSDRSINVVFPRGADKGSAFEIKRHSSRRLPLLRAFLPDCVLQSRDTLMLFASTQPIPLLEYEQSGFCNETRGVQVHPGVGVRGWTADPGLWTTVRRVVGVRR